jgi:ABC-type bacteriocin/lantibiotic exporter with double-glycine peptidase domain
MTHCDEFINRFPQGLATPITEKGYSLSGGEIQKISLARALLGNHALLILDEPSNHLEPNVFRDILDKIKKLKSGPTVLIVSQDPSIACQADLVLAIEQGKIKRVEKPN